METLKETYKTETIPTGYTDREYKEIKFKGLTFEVRQDDSDDSFDVLDEDEFCFLVNYHRDFWITRDEIITEDEVRDLYQGKKNWDKVEKEKGFWIFELSCLIHGGVWLNFGGGGFVSDSYGWDTSRVGLVLVSKKIAKTMKKAEEIGRDFVDQYNKVLSGDVYNILVKKGEEVIDDISGIIGLDEVYKWIKEYSK